MKTTLTTRPKQVKCAAEGCKVRFFVLEPGPAGRQRIYHSNTCGNRERQRRFKAKAKAKAKS